MISIGKVLSLEFLKASLSYLNTHLKVKNGEFEFEQSEEAQIIYDLRLVRRKTLSMIQEYNTMKFKAVKTGGDNLENSGWVNE